MPSRHRPEPEPRQWHVAVLGGALMLAGVAEHGSRKLWRGLAHLPSLLARAERRAVPVLVALARAVAEGVATAVDGLSRGLPALGRGVAVAIGATVHGIARGVECLGSAARPAFARTEAGLVAGLSALIRLVAWAVGVSVHWLALAVLDATRIARQAGKRTSGPAGSAAQACRRWLEAAARAAGRQAAAGARVAARHAAAAARVAARVAARHAAAGGRVAGTHAAAAARVAARVAARHAAAGARLAGRTSVRLGHSGAIAGAAAARSGAGAGAAAATAGGRWARVWLPVVGRVGLKTTAWACLLGLVVVAIAVPGLRLAASAVDLEGAEPEGGDAHLLAADGATDSDEGADADPASEAEAALPPLEERSTVYAADGTPLGVLHGDVNRRVVDLEDVPDHVVDAVIAAEDRRFYSHDGYDLEGIGRALRANLAEGEIVQGASTITQQLAKQNYVGNEQVLSRKVNELVHAIALEDNLSKQELLARYLNQVYFGAGAYGVAAASEEWFGVPPDELSVEDAALLAGMIRSPSALDPRRYPERAKERRNQVLTSMVAAGNLEPEEAERLREAPVEVLEEGPDLVGHPRALAAIKREFLSEPAFGDSRDERARQLLTGGLSIQTTIEPDMQRAAREAVDGMLASGRSHGPAAAVAAVDPRTGQVRALHSSTDFATERFDLAAQSRRQPGSAFKPFVLAAALEEGESLQQTLEGTSPSTFDVPGQDKKWKVSNYEGESFGPVTVREALTKSVNTAFAELITDIGTEPVVDLATELGIDEEDAFGPESSRGPSIALGGLTHGVSPLDMASAYGTFANEGVHTRPYLVQRITNDGETVFNGLPREPRQALSEDTNEAMLQALSDVVEEGTGTPAELDHWQAIGKTGTTQQDADAWFVGAVTDLSTAVWVGHPDGQTPVPGLSGSSLPAPLWRQFMQRALEGEEPQTFDEAKSEQGSPGEAGEASEASEASEVQ